MLENKLSWLVLGLGVLATAWGFWLKFGVPEAPQKKEWVTRNGRLVERETSEPYQGLREIPFDGAQTLIEWEFNYLDGVRHGPAIEYFPTPAKRVKTRTQYIDGKRHGPFVSYYPNGVKQSEGMAVDGHLSGLMTFYDPDGTVSERLVYERSAPAGIPAVTATPELVQAPEEAIDVTEIDLADAEQPLMLDPQGNPFTGTQVGTFHGGKKAFAHSYKDGREDGMHQAWNPAGKPEYQRPYLDRKKHGAWKLWGADSKLLREEHFHHGLQVGRAHTWFPSGQPRQTSQFVHGAEHGVRTEFTPDGLKRRELTYDHGLLVRETEWTKDGREIANDSLPPIVEGATLTIEPGEEETTKSAPISNLPEDAVGEIIINYRFRLSSLVDAEHEANAARPITVSILHDGVAREFDEFRGELGGGWQLKQLAISTTPGESLSLEVRAAPGSLQLDLAGIAYIDDSGSSEPPERFETTPE